MSDEDLHEFDLSAWEAPEPPRDLASRIVARMRAAGPVVLEPESHASRRRWWLAAAGALVVAAGGVALLVTLGSKHAAPTSGELVAARAQRLVLDTATAELEAGADIAWHRTGDALVVEQRAGNATWQVTDDHLQLAAGSAAAKATIDATGASLRVEVHMQLSDARVLGASTLTAAAVAFATVVVYEGHVKVTSGGQTVNVEPGATVEVRPDQPAGPPLVGASEQRTRELENKVAELQHRLDEMSQQAVGVGPAPAPSPPPPTPTPTPSNCDEVSCVLNNYAGACCAKYHHATQPDALDRNAISEGIAAVTLSVTACGDSHPANGTVKVHVKVAASGNVADVSVTQSPDPGLGTCVADAIRLARFAITKHGGSFSYPFVFSSSASTACDADTIAQKGREAEAIGQHDAALRAFEDALRCKPNETRYVDLAFMAACNGKNAAKAKAYYVKLAAGPKREALTQMCVRNGIRQADLDAVVTPTKATGTLEINSKPSGLPIRIDDKDTALKTPAQLVIEAGKHKVTLINGSERYSYPTTVVAGETDVMFKDLE